MMELMATCYIRILTPDGLQPAPYTADSLADAVRYEPEDGVYTLTNTYNIFQVLKLDAHLDRLEDSGRREGIPLHLNRPALRAALRQMIADANVGDVRFRITIPRQQPDHITLSLEPFKPPPPEVYETGIRCVTLPGSARHNPASKTTDWMHDRRQIVLPEGIFEGLLLDDNGAILEGTNSNFYAILNDELRTAGTGILPGIAQQIVFEVAPAVLPVCRQPVQVGDIPCLSEAFITSSSRGIVPVVELDGVSIGDGKPGVRTTALREAYLAWVRAHLEEL
jgi:branched-chain amino acid aminotransferase